MQLQISQVIFGDDFIPYLGSENDLTSVIGYRDGAVWYDANGQIVVNPDLIAQQSSSGSILPAKKDGAGTLAGEDWNTDARFPRLRSSNSSNATCRI